MMKRKKLFDKQNNLLKAGDDIMYITDGPRINYGTIKKIERSETCFGYKHWKIKVWKTHGMFLVKARYVWLTEPTVFKCGVPIKRLSIE